MTAQPQHVPDELLLAGLIEANRDHHHVPAGPAITDHPDDHVEWLRAALSAVLPVHEAEVRAKVAEELRAEADAHRRLVARMPSAHDEARLARAKTLDDAAGRIGRVR
jgi:hypothetical protein